MRARPGRNTCPINGGGEGEEKEMSHPYYCGVGTNRYWYGMRRVKRLTRFLVGRYVERHMLRLVTKGRLGGYC
jgi:hypothetical protein